MSTGNVDQRNFSLGEGNKHRLAHAGVDFYQVTGAEIMDRDHAAQRPALRVPRFLRMLILAALDFLMCLLLPIALEAFLPTRLVLDISRVIY